MGFVVLFLKTLSQPTRIKAKLYAVFLLKKKNKLYHNLHLLL